MSYFIRRHVVFALTFMILLLMLSWFAFSPRRVAGLDDLEPPSEEREITLVNHLGQNYIISAIAIQDDYAYIAADPGLGRAPGMAVLDISNPRAPQNVSFLPLAGQADDIFVAEGYVFARVGGEHKIIDISKPTRPREVGQLSGSEIKAVEGNMAYVRDGGGILRIWDISDPAAVLEVAHYVYGSAPIEVANHHAYVLEGTGVRIVNLSEPTAPVEVGWLEIEGTAIAVRDQSLVVSWGECRTEILKFYDVCDSCEGSIRVFDLSQPTNPIEVGVYQTDVAIERMVVENDYALTYGKYCDFNPRFPSKYLYFYLVNLSSFTARLRTSASRYTDIGAVKDDYLYLVYGTEGLEIWHETHKAADEEVEFIGTYGTQATERDVVVVNDLAFLVGDEHKLRVLDVSNPTFPIEVVTWHGNGQKIVVFDNYLYTIYNNKFYIIDITEPTAPRQVAFYQYSGVLDIAVGDGVAYLATEGNDLHVLDISEPTDATRIGSTSVITDIWAPYQIRKIAAVEDNYVHVTWSDCDYDPHIGITCSSGLGGTSIIDVSNPMTPTLVTMYGGLIGPVEVKDQYAYVGEFQNLQIFDVSDPTNPTVVASHALSDTLNALTIKNNHAYLATDGGITVLNISDPTNPEDVGSYAIPTASTGVSVSDGYIYSANGNWGLITLQVGSRLEGRVEHANGLPFSGVIVSSTAELSATSNSEGRYAFLEQASGSYTLMPAHADFLFSPPTQRVSVPPNATANFTILSAPVSVTLTPANSTTLLISDTQGLLSDVEWPAGSVSLTTTLRIRPTLAANEANFTFAAHAFELMAYQNGHEMPDFTFNTPFTITLRYSEADVRLISHENQNQLALWWQQDDTTWQDATQSCETPTAYQRDILNKQISVPICRTGRLALFGPTNQLFLPLLFR